MLGQSMISDHKTGSDKTTNLGEQSYFSVVNQWTVFRCMELFWHGQSIQLVLSFQ